MMYNFIKSNLVQNNDYLYMIDVDNTIYKIDKINGTIYDSQKFNYPFNFDLVKDSTDYLYIQTENGYILRISYNLNLIWKQNFINNNLIKNNNAVIPYTQNDIFKVLLVDKFDNVLVSYKNYLLSINKNQELVWKYSQEDIKYYNQIVNKNNDIFISTNKAKIIQLNEYGVFKNEFEITINEENEESNIYQSCQVNNNLLYIPTLNNKIEVYDIVNKEKLENININEPITNQLYFDKFGNLIAQGLSNTYYIKTPHIKNEYSVWFKNGQNYKNSYSNNERQENFIYEDINITDRSNVLIDLPDQKKYELINSKGSIFYDGNYKYAYNPNTDDVGIYNIEIQGYNSSNIQFKIFFNINVKPHISPLIWEDNMEFVYKENEKIEIELDNYLIHENPVNYEIIYNNDSLSRILMEQKSFLIKQEEEKETYLYDVYMTENKDDLNYLVPNISLDYKILEKVDISQFMIKDYQEFNKVYYIKVCQYDQTNSFYIQDSPIYTFHSIHDYQFIQDNKFYWTPRYDTFGEYIFTIKQQDVNGQVQYTDIKINIVKNENIPKDIYLLLPYNKITNVDPTNLILKWNKPNLDKEQTILYDIFLDVLPEPRIFISNLIDNELIVKELEENQTYFLKIKQKTSEKYFCESIIYSFTTQDLNEKTLYKNWETI